MESTQVEVSQPKNLAVQSQQHGDSLSEDIQLPRILLLQGKNKLLEQLNLKDGDIINESTKELLACPTTDVEFIPLATSPFWDWYFLDGKKEWVESCPRTSANPEWRNKDFQANKIDKAGKARAAKPKPSIVAMVLFADEAQGGLPAVLRFKKSSYFSGGKTIETMKTELRMMKHPFYARTFKLSCMETTYDDNTYKVFTVKRGKESTPEQKERAKQWDGYFDKKPITTTADEEGD